MNTTERNIAAAVARRLNVSGGPDGGIGIEMGDPINPDHYKFPSGVEVIDLSEHLTSNAGQAVQYLARACRLDGRVKSDPVEDVKKAVWFAQRELARLEAQR